MSVEQFLTDKERIRALEECLSCIFTAVLWRDGDAVQGERDQIWLRDQAIAIAEEATKYAAETPSDHRVFRAARAYLEGVSIGCKPREGLLEELLAEEQDPSAGGPR